MAVTIGAALNYNRIFGAPKTVRKTAAGWIGSKAGKIGDFVTIDANGYIDQAAAAGNPIASGTKLGILNTDVASTVAAGSDEALAVSFFTGTDFEIEMQCTTGAGAAVSSNAATLVGDQYEIYRHSGGRYHVDTSETTDLKIIVTDIGPTYPVGTSGGTVKVRLIDAQCAL